MRFPGRTEISTLRFTPLRFDGNERMAISLIVFPIPAKLAKYLLYSGALSTPLRFALQGSPLGQGDDSF